MSKNKKTPIYLTKKEIELFKRFREYQEEFKVLLRANLFEMKNGKCIVHKDENGIIQQIDVNNISYRRRSLDKEAKKAKIK